VMPSLATVMPTSQRGMMCVRDSPPRAAHPQRNLTLGFCEREFSFQAERRAATAPDAAAALDSEEEEDEDEELQGDAIDEESQSVTRSSRRKRMAAGAKEAGLGLAGSRATVTTASVHLLKCLVCIVATRTQVVELKQLSGQR